MVVVVVVVVVDWDYEGFEERAKEEDAGEEERVDDRGEGDGVEAEAVGYGAGREMDLLGEDVVGCEGADGDGEGDELNAGPDDDGRIA